MSEREVEDRAVQWGWDKGIFKYSTPIAQTGKLIEEVIELGQAMALCNEGREDLQAKHIGELIDAIGDVWVTLVMVCNCNSQSLGPIEAYPAIVTAKDAYKEIVKLLPKIAELAMLKHDRLQSLCKQVYECLPTICEEYQVNLDFCKTSAWLVIKDRKGRMSQDGVFVKEES